MKAFGILGYLLKITLAYLLSEYVCMFGGHMCAMIHVWRSEDNVWESVLSCLVGIGGQTQVISLGGKHLCLLSQIYNFLFYIYNF